MWIFFPDAMLSVVAHRDKFDVLLVRARFAGDIERIFPGARVTRTPAADYLYRAEVHRRTFADVLSLHVLKMSYRNVKGAIHCGDRRRSDAMGKVWDVMRSAQHSAEPFSGHDAAGDADEPVRLHSGAWYSHVTARGEHRTVFVHGIQQRIDGEPVASLEYRPTGARYTIPMRQAES